MKYEDREITQQNSEPAANGSVTDEELVRRAQAGSRDAEEELLRRYKPWALQYSRMYHIAGADRDDVLQECMIGLFRAVQNYDSRRGASFQTFAEICVRRNVLTAIRAADREKHRALNQAISLDGSATGPGGHPLEETLPSLSYGDPAESVWVRDMETMLERSELPFLSPLENEIWQQLRAGKTCREIAEDLGRKPKSVDNAVQRIKAKCRRFFENGWNG